MGKANFVDSRALAARGGSAPVPGKIDSLDGGAVETFADPADLATRKTYVEGLAKTPIFAEYDEAFGLVLLRVSGKLTPDQEASYKAAMPDAAK